MEKNTKAIYKKAGFFERLWAFIIDRILIYLLVYLLGLILKQLKVEIPLLYLIIAVLFGAIFIWKTGATPGKMLFKLKVVTTSYQPVGFGYALLRESIGKLLSAILINLGYLWMLIDKRKQTWHDKLAHTYVVKLDKSGNVIPINDDEPITRKHKIIFVIGYLAVILPFILATFALITYSYFYRPFQIAGAAMNPHYVNGQYYITDIHFGVPKRGDVIIFIAPTDKNKDFIKRVIALPGDSVMVKEGFVYVNDKKLDESAYLSQDIRTYGGDFLRDAEPVTVPQGNYFVLGDNRSYSSDSREWGFVTGKSIISKVTFCYWKCELSPK